MSTIFHIALPEDLADAEREGTYDMSTRDVTLGEQGYIHASANAAQVEMVRLAIYDDRDDLVLLELDTDELAEVGLTVAMEPGDPEDPDSDLFPHIYGGVIPFRLLHRIEWPTR
ncbi:DUF952 domain-containing protein [Trueperella pecoris]|uniref:DUF952 domain-containing protein n=1 Tax=Trueperella pecoris TaxID=2733571 RepID=A0A7M1R189_9ACTO|nr:DUF952 domain-containing protein [Trueperella pecoris]QOR47305.1 DUF952 domain-containing protein [Trueperella pecoris]